MNYKLKLFTLLATLLTIVNCLVIENEVGDIKLNNPNVKYSKSSSSVGSKVSSGIKGVLKWILIATAVVVVVIIVIVILCCLGICTCCCAATSSKKESYESSPKINTARPYGSEPEVITVAPEATPQPPQPSYNPVYPSYGAQPAPYQQPGSYPPPQGSYPQPSAPYGQPMYPNV
ncbi:hypothetical protein PIROE2DRAFT_68445 [Piromyces sp. E2]|nr:hypothetical protein PIROE2DRAFT_68445 [Piromyces sp. E2]|eukprot:OUM70160.1 hypothetical protein PIROE2DRAFT_68445 [Piromyces sp. E2]